MLVIDDYYTEINNSIKELKQLYKFELPLINTNNIIHSNADKIAATNETIKKLEQQKNKGSKRKTYLYF